MSCSVAGEQRQTEAEKLLQRSFEARSSSPASFVFLCDELAGVVQGEGEGLPPALASWLRHAATEELENFLADRQPHPPDVQVRQTLPQTDRGPHRQRPNRLGQSAGLHRCANEQALIDNPVLECALSLGYATTVIENSDYVHLEVSRECIP